jgi:hypothetical protein
MYVPFIPPFFHTPLHVQRTISTKLTDTKNTPTRSAPNQPARTSPNSATDAPPPPHWERPFACPTCRKTFKHRSNLRRHAAVHAGDAAKKYVCRLDGCRKGFTQLWKLKIHMNQFLTETLRELTRRFAAANAGSGEGKVGEEGEEGKLLGYFRSLYRNANKGNKGRGNGRKVAPSSSSSYATSISSVSSTSLPALSTSTSSESSSSSSYSSSGMDVNFGVTLSLGLGMGTAMGMGGVSLGTVYEGYEEEEEPLAFDILSVWNNFLG